MPTEMKLWEIESNRPVLIERSKLDFEERLEDWIVEDISLVSSNLLVIGRQVSTDYGGSIDLLAIDQDGNLVILELKRHKTPRDIVAQILDYASWVEGLGATKVEEIANSFLNNGPLETAFKSKFHTDLPEVLNESHRMYVVASEIDASSERIVRYLSEYHNVDINIATFSFFKTGNRELVGKSFLLDETEVQNRAKTRSKRKPPLSWEELEELAEQNNVLQLYLQALAGLRPLFDSAGRTRSNVSLIGYMGENKARNVIVNIVPEATPRESQLIGIAVIVKRFSEYFNVSQEEVRAFLGNPDPSLNWYSDDTYAFDSEKLTRFVDYVKNLKEKKNK